MIKQIENYPDISFIDNKKLEDFAEDARSWYTEHWTELTGENIKLYDTDEEKILLDAVSYIFYQVAQYIDNAGKQNLLKYSMGDFLDNIGARCGVERNPAMPATVTVRFTLTEPQESDYVIPAGTQVAAADSDDIYFSTDEDVTIPAGDTYADVACTCMTDGEDGNGIEAGMIDELVDTLPFIDSVENTTISDGGADEEDDDTLAERIFLAPSEYSTCGTEDSYIFHAKSASTLVNDVSVSSPEPCYLTITITSKTGMPSAELIQIVTNYLNDPVRKKLTDRITVTGPSAVNFSVDLTYYISYDNQKYEETIKEQVEAAVDEYITWQTTKIGRNINPSKLTQMVIDAGANRVTITYPTQAIVEADELAVLEVKTVTYGGLEYE